jgi:holo-[acyl-carrier protein] synthase
VREHVQDTESCPWGPASMLSVGVDIIEISRIARTLESFGERFLRRVYTPAEVAYCRGRVPELAARFAAKEAISKALGTGLVGITWSEMEVLADRRGKPTVSLSGRARSRAETIHLNQWAVSLSHSDDLAIAMVVATYTPAP